MKRIFPFLICLSFYLPIEAQFSPVFVTIGKRETSVSHDGNVLGLRGVEKVNIIYDYKNLQVGEYGNEENYIKARTEKYYRNGDSEKAEKFRESWFSAREKRYEPRFELLFNKYGKKNNISGTNYANSNDVTMLVKTIYTDPGFFTGFVNKYTYIDIRVVFLDKNNHVICYYFLKNIIGGDIANCYAEAAKKLIKALRNTLK